MKPCGASDGRYIPAAQNSAAHTLPQTCTLWRSLPVPQTPQERLPAGQQLQPQGSTARTRGKPRKAGSPAVHESRRVRHAL
ncbi:MAG: hypothetical protein LBB80_05480 [Treponema sp.]|nr:hypothetical protein [Treponema sp.]